MTFSECVMSHDTVTAWTTNNTYPIFNITMDMNIFPLLCLCKSKKVSGDSTVAELSNKDCTPTASALNPIKHVKDVVEQERHIIDVQPTNME